MGLADRVALEFRRRIEAGELRPGDCLPTLGDMVARGVSRTTTRAAWDRLKGWGLVSGGRGRALRVRVPHRKVVRSTTRHATEKARVLLSEAERRTWGTAEHELGVSIGDVDFRAAYDRIEAPGDLAELFGTAVAEPLLRRRYETRYREGGVLAASSVSYIPISLVAGNPRLVDAAEEPWPGGTQHQLSTVGIELARVIDRTTARVPVAEERQEWGMEPGDVLLVVRSIAQDATGRVVVVSDALYPADRTILEAVTELAPWAATG